MIDSARPEERIRGPTIRPSATPRRSMWPTCGAEPTSRTVVKPARAVIRAFSTPRTMAHSSGSTASRQNSPLGLPERWTWASIRPGSTVRFDRSISRAPAGAGSSPLVTLWMRPSTMVMVEGPLAGRDASAISRPAWTMMVSAAAGVARKRTSNASRRAIIFGLPSSEAREPCDRRRRGDKKKPGALGAPGFPLPLGCRTAPTRRSCRSRRRPRRCTCRRAGRRYNSGPTACPEARRAGDTARDR